MNGVSEQQQKHTTAAGKGRGTTTRVNAATRKPQGTSRPREDIAFLDEAGYTALVAAADEALARDATKEDALYHKAVALGFLGRVEAAGRTASTLLDIDGTNPRYVFLEAALRFLGRAPSAGDPKEQEAAAETLRTAMALKPSDAASWLAAAELLKSAGAPATDLVALLLLASERPWRDTVALGILGDQLQECGEYALAARCYDRALQFRGGTSHALTQLAWFMLAWGHADTARLLLDEALAAAPRAREALFAAYYLDNQENRLEEALGHVHEVNALRRSRETGEAEIDVLGKLGRASDQVLTLDGFIQSEGDGALCSRWMARKSRILLDGGEVEAALAVATSATNRYGLTGPALLLRAMALERKNRHYDALLALDICRDEKEMAATVDYWLTRSCALSATMDLEKALEAAWEATRRSPDDERGWKQVLLLSRTLGRPKDGAAAATHLLGCQDPTCAFLAAMVLSLMAARFYEAAGQFADRLSMAEPTDPDTLYLLGSLYSRMGNRVKADECFVASERADREATRNNKGGAPHE